MPFEVGKLGGDKCFCPSFGMCVFLCVCKCACRQTYIRWAWVACAHDNGVQTTMKNEQKTHTLYSTEHRENSISSHKINYQTEKWDSSTSTNKKLAGFLVLPLPDFGSNWITKTINRRRSSLLGNYSNDFLAEMPSLLLTHNNMRQYGTMYNLPAVLAGKSMQNAKTDAKRERERTRIAQLKSHC